MKQSFVLKRQTLRELTVWCQALFHLAYGPKEGERRFRNVRVIQLLPLWKGVHTCT